ncbi:SMI1/KNR4 family protein [Rubinisphaera margarita]|uniref:SMI1/KNR4 family protein n=1 Tax=Rubinisphaera margarita TaxID=2909586 RepID=UPI001EE83AD2|nr:SMI1/KNR4 family protein [Rubinisphaera margarita]MCG6154922.1 SMI1/KNR4 family protein [Rubinisphaera margarita]
MRNETIELLRAEFAESPILHAQSFPSNEEVDHASRELGVPFDSDFREFLLKFGGAMVGPYPIFGLRPVEVMGNDHWSVVDVTRWYRNNGVPGSEAFVVISEDHSGNPVGMDANGRVWIYDHDFGGLAELSPTFETYLRIQCLHVDA